MQNTKFQNLLNMTMTDSRATRILDGFCILNVMVCLLSKQVAAVIVKSSLSVSSVVFSLFIDTVHIPLLLRHCWLGKCTNNILLYLDT